MNLIIKYQMKIKKMISKKKRKNDNLYFQEII